MRALPGELIHLTHGLAEDDVFAYASIISRMGLHRNLQPIRVDECPWLHSPAALSELSISPIVLRSILHGMSQTEPSFIQREDSTIACPTRFVAQF